MSPVTCWEFRSNPSCTEFSLY